MYNHQILAIITYAYCGWYPDIASFSTTGTNIMTDVALLKLLFFCLIIYSFKKGNCRVFVNTPVIKNE